MLKRVSRSVVLHISNKLNSSSYLTNERQNWRKLKTMTEPVKIGTHNGMFHCDEALACFMLKTLPEYKDAVIVRSRDMSILDTCNIVVDVGQVYDHSKHRYDHHMRDFKESVSTVIKKPGYDWKIKLSSAGLVFCHFGHKIIKQIVPEASDTYVEHIFKRVYDTFIQEIDAIDNGVSMYKEEPLYYIVTHLSARVKLLNPAWNSKDVDIYQQFLKAVALTGQEFMDHVKNAANVWLPARSIVEESIKNRFKVDPSGEIIEFPHFVPWDHFFTLEKELNIQPLMKMVIYEDKGECKMGCVPVGPRSFVSRMPLPESWAGLRTQELERACGVKGAIFVHASRHFGINQTRDGALMMTRKALEIGKTHAAESN